MSRLEELAAARRRAELVGRMRTIAAGAGGPREPARARSTDERCDICNATMPADRRHLIHLVERRIVCACEACWAMHSGDADYRPAGMRTAWLEDFVFTDERWASFQIPIGLAFFMRSGMTGGIVAFYPSPAGATESELDLEAWDALVAENPVLEDLEPDGEALIVNRMADEHQYAIAPIDDCYRLVGMIKSRWEGISGGSALDQAVPEFFEMLRARVAAYSKAPW